MLQLLPERAPVVVHLVLFELRTNELHGMVGHNRQEQVPFNALILAVVDGPESEVGLERPERGFDVGELPIRAHDALQGPVGVTRAQDVAARRLVGCVVALLVREFHRADVRTAFRLLDAHLVLAGHLLVALLLASDRAKHRGVALRAAPFREVRVQPHELGLKTMPLLLQYAVGGAVERACGRRLLLQVQELQYRRIR